MAGKFPNFQSSWTCEVVVVELLTLDLLAAAFQARPVRVAVALKAPRISTWIPANLLYSAAVIRRQARLGCGSWDSRGRPIRVLPNRTENHAQSLGERFQPRNGDVLVLVARLYLPAARA